MYNFQLSKHIDPSVLSDADVKHDSSVNTSPLNLRVDSLIPTFPHTRVLFLTTKRNGSAKLAS